MADIAQTAANVALVSGPTAPGIAASAITAGQPVYAVSGVTPNAAATYSPAKADTAAHAAAAGIALCNAAVGQPFILALPGALVNMGGTLVVGGCIVVAADNAGAIAPYADLTTGQYVSVLGIAQSAANLPFNPTVSGTAHA